MNDRGRIIVIATAWLQRVNSWQAAGCTLRSRPIVRPPIEVVKRTTTTTRKESCVGIRLQRGENHIPVIKEFDFLLLRVLDKLMILPIAW
jgi:hypothetical protein